MTTPRRALLSATVVALTLNADGSASTSQVIIPAGEFSSPDGRPSSQTGGKIKSWKNGADQFATMQRMVNELGRPICVDYEHALVKKIPNGDKAIAAGWIQPTALSYDPTNGTKARIDWTDAAAAHIRARELAYLSPVFMFDEQGNVQSLHSVALTNNPALSQLAVAALSAELADTSQPTDDITGDTNVNLAVLICATLGIAATATEEQVVAHVADLSKLAKAEPDPTKFVALATLTAEQSAHAAVRTQLAALTTQMNVAALDAEIATAKDAGAVLTAEYEKDIREVADKMGVAKAKALLEALPKAAALAGKSQTGGTPPKSGKADGGLAVLTDSQKSMAKILGCDETAYAAELERQRGFGLTV